MAGRAKRNTSPAEWMTFGGLCLLAVAASITVGEVAPYVVPRRGPPPAPAPAPADAAPDVTTAPPVDPGRVALPADLPPPYGVTLRLPFEGALVRLRGVLARTHTIVIDGSGLFLEPGEVLARRWLREDGQRLVVVRYRVEGRADDGQALAVTVDVMRRDAPGAPWERASPRPIEALSLRVDPETLERAVDISSAGADVVAVRFPARGTCRGGDARAARTTYASTEGEPTKLLSVISEGARAFDPHDTALLSLRWAAQAGEAGEGEATLQRRLDGLTTRAVSAARLDLTPRRRAGFGRLHLRAGDAVEVEVEGTRWQAQVLSVAPDLLSLALSAGAPDPLASGASARLHLPPHRFAFQRRRDGFRVWPDRLLPTLDGLPALWSLDEDALTRAERALAAAPDPAAAADLERRYAGLIEGLSWVADLDGPPPYCVETPHRALLAEGIDPYAWQSDLAKRMTRLRLSQALLIAAAGDGPRALDALGEPDPSHALQGSLRGELLLRTLRDQPAPSPGAPALAGGGPQLKDLRYDLKRPYLRPAPTLARPALRPQPLPLRWQAEGVLRLSLPPSPAQAARALSLTLRAPRAAPVAPTAHGAHGGRPRAGDVVAAALLSPARASARALLYSASEEVLDLRGPALTRRAVPSRSDDAERGLLTAPTDASPLQTGLLLDWGLTCDGWAVIACRGVAATCANPAALGLRPGAFAQNMTVALSHPWLVVISLPLPASPPACGADGLPASAPAPLRLLGWLDERRWLLSDGTHLWAAPPSPEGALAPVPLADLAADPARWLHGFGGDQRRFSPYIDRFGIWLWDHKRARFTLLDWWLSRDIALTPPATGLGLAALSPRGQWLAVWSEGHGLMVGRVTQLPP